MPRVPKSMAIKPPAHWLIPQTEDIKGANEGTQISDSEKPEMFEDLKHLFFNSNNVSSSSSVVSVKNIHTPD